jgi:hypothetical protein
LKYPPFPWGQNFQDGAHKITGAQRKFFEKGTIFFGHPIFLHKNICTLLTITLPPGRRIFLILPPESRAIVVGKIKRKIDLIDEGSVGLNVLGGH